MLPSFSLCLRVLQVLLVPQDQGEVMVLQGPLGLLAALVQKVQKEFKVRR